MIIVEGPDGSGKTTLVRELAKEFNLPIADKVVGSDTNPTIENLADWVEKMLRDAPHRMLYDRHPLISEPIYSAALRHEPMHPRFSNMGWWIGRIQQFNDIRPFIIMCIPPLKTVCDNCLSDLSQPDSVVKKMPVIYASYVADAARRIVDGKAISYDYTMPESRERVTMTLGHWLATKGWIN